MTYKIKNKQEIINEKHGNREIILKKATLFSYRCGLNFAVRKAKVKEKCMQCWKESFPVKFVAHY